MEKNKLHNIKNTGFKVPNDYFESLDDIILSEIKLKNTITDSGFSVPETYLETLEDRILNKVSRNKTPKVIPLFSKSRLVYASSIAAAILLLFNLSIFEKNITFDSLDIDNVESYIMNEAFDSYEIATLLAEEELTEDNFIDYDFDEETIEAYIIDNLDIEYLIIQ